MADSSKPRHFTDCVIYIEQNGKSNIEFNTNFMKTNSQFYIKLPPMYNIILCILYIIFNICTLGLMHNLTYDFFIEHKYWLNRRILNKYLNQKDLNFTKRTLEYFPDIVEYKFKTFKVLIYTKELKLSLHLLDIYTDTIGLFTSSSSEDYYVSNLIRKLNNL